MPNFQFLAVGDDGLSMRGELDAPDKGSVAARLHAQGAIPLRIERIETGTLGALLANDVFGRRKLSPSAITEMIQRMATLLGGDVSIEQALAILGDRQGVPAVRQLALDLLRRLRDGAQLADAMDAHKNAFPPIVVGMVRAGETSGALPQTLTRLADYLQRSEEARQTIKSALIYPTILLVTATGSILVVLTLVLPALRPAIVDFGGALPLPTRIAFVASDLVRDFWWVLVFGGIALVIGLRAALSNPDGKSRRDRVLLRSPWVGAIVLQAELARFARTLGTLVAGGVSLPTSLGLAQPVIANTVIAAAIGRVASGLREGGGLAEPLAQTGAFPDLTIQLIRIGEATGRLDAMLIQLADIYDVQVRRSVSRGIAVLVPALTIGLGAVVAGIISSVMLAVLSANDLVR